MTVLAIDSSGEYGGIAIADSSGLNEEIAVHSPDGFAHLLFGELEQLLIRTGIRLDEIDAFAAANGPGSFTGVRIALTAAKGLAEAQHKPLFAVSNLQALAACGSAPLRAVTLDARRGDIYAAIYNQALECIGEEIVTQQDRWIKAIPQNAEIVEARRTVAGAVAKIALSRLSNGEKPDPVSAAANYVRRSDAEMKWTEA
jgi:tRNA threonylcarbamoyladenosine biosynthesis protein TsaB